jgi:kynurenine formamidase
MDLGIMLIRRRSFGLMGRALMIFYLRMSTAFIVSCTRSKLTLLTCAAWVERGGIVGRGVLLDYASWADKNNVALTPFETKSITVSTLKEVAKSQGTTFQKGDILFIRTGWIQAYDKLSDDECKTLASYKVPPAHGVESSEETLRWLWEQDFAAVAGDQPSMEAWPCQNTDFFLHEWLLAGWGMPIGELFDLERLSEECRKRKRYTFFFGSMPLNVSHKQSPEEEAEG